MKLMRSTYINIALIFTLIETLVYPGHSYAGNMALRVPSSFQKGDFSLGEKFKVIADLSEEDESSYRGLGEIIRTKGVSMDTVFLLKKAIEAIISQMPQSSIEAIYADSLIDKIPIRITIDSHQKVSIVSKSHKSVNLLIGEDILYRKGKVESILLSEMISELLAAFILDDYVELKRLSHINENAYFKLETVKALLNYKNYMPVLYKFLHVSENDWIKKNYLSEESLPEQKRVLVKYKEAVKDWKPINKLGSYSYMFEEIMSNPNFSPAAVVLYYINTVFKKEMIVDEDVTVLINNISRINIKNRPSIAGIRNLVKDFMLSETYYERVDYKVELRKRFACFDNSKDIQRLKRVLHGTTDEQEFYESFQKLLKISLNLEDSYIREEARIFLDKDIFSIPASYEGPRATPIRKSIEEILCRRIGKAAYGTFTSYLLGNKDNIYYPVFNLGKVSRKNQEDSYFVGHEPSSSDFYDRTKEFFPMIQVNPVICFQYIKDMGVANVEDLIQKKLRGTGRHFVRSAIHMELDILRYLGLIEEVKEKKDYSYRVADIAKDLHYKQVAFFCRGESLLSVHRLMKEVKTSI